MHAEAPRPNGGYLGQGGEQDGPDSIVLHTPSGEALVVTGSQLFLGCFGPCPFLEGRAPLGWHVEPGSRRLGVLGACSSPSPLWPQVWHGSGVGGWLWGQQRHRLRTTASLGL